MLLEKLFVLGFGQDQRFITTNRLLPKIMQSSSPTSSASDEDKKNFIMKQVLFWFYHLFIVVIAVLLIVYATQAKDQVSNIQTLPEYSRAMETLDFWGMGYIIDIKAVSTMNCPQGYESLIDYKWDGTSEGCSCQTLLNNYYYQVILEGICSADLIQNGCERVPPLEAEAMNFWKGGKLLCAKRIKSLTFYNSTYPTSTTTCANNQSYQVQTYINVSCPISNLSNTTLGASSTSFVLDSTTLDSLFYLRSSGYPIAAFKMTEYEFCPTFSQKNISPNKTGNYILEPNNITECSGKDPRVVVIDEINEQSLISNNYNVKIAINELPAYPRPSNVYNFKLGYVPYPAWTYACRTNPSLNLTVTSEHLRLTDQKYISVFVFAFTVSFSIVFGFVFRLFYLIRRVKELKGKHQYGRIFENQRQLARKVPNLNYVHNRKGEIVLVVIDLALVIGLLVVLLIGVSRFSSYSLWYKSIFQNSCTDNFLNLVLQHYETGLGKGYYALVVCTVLDLLILFFGVLFVIFRCRGGDLRPQQKIVLDGEQASSDDANRINGQPDSSQIELKDKDLKMDLDLVMDDGIERDTRDNFYNVYSAENELGVKKKRKKKPIKKRNLFKRDPAEDSKQPE